MRVPERLVIVEGLNAELGASPWRDLASRDLQRYGHAVLRVATLDGRDVITGVMDPVRVGAADAELWSSAVTTANDDAALVAFHHALARVMGRRPGCCSGEVCRILGERHVSPAPRAFFEQLVVGRDRDFGPSPLARVMGLLR